MTKCKPKPIEFHALGSREVVAQFDGGDITSDGGGLILREVEQRTGILKKFAACFVDYRKREAIEHPVEDLVSQRAYGVCLGYEDLNDHDELRADPLLAVMVGKTDPKGERRREARDRGKALAGKSTLNRLELTRADAGTQERYKKIVMQPEAIDRLMVVICMSRNMDFLLGQGVLTPDMPYLRKPFTRTEVLEKVREVLGPSQRGRYISCPQCSAVIWGVQICVTSEKGLQPRNETCAPNSFSESKRASNLFLAEPSEESSAI